MPELVHVWISPQLLLLRRSCRHESTCRRDPRAPPTLLVLLSVVDSMSLLSAARRRVDSMLSASLTACSVAEYLPLLRARYDAMLVSYYALHQVLKLEKVSYEEVSGALK